MKRTINDNLPQKAGLTAPVAFFVVMAILLPLMPCHGQSGGNLAPLAKVEGNGEHIEMLTDGIKGADAKNEWFV